jgi:oleate hydratase
MKRLKNSNPIDSRIYLVGSGISSLASAVYLIQDAGVPATNIHILEQNDIIGGALDGAGKPDQGFVVRGGRMHEEHFVCYWDLLSRVGSLENPDVTIRDESFDFSSRYVANSQARLLRDGEKIDVSSFNVPVADQARMLKLMFASEKSLGKLRIEDWFSHTFFESNFWFIFTTMFAFQKWSSVIEMKRYMERFIHLLPGLEKLQGVMRTKYDQYHSVALPIARCLREVGVHFDTGVQVTDIDFDLSLDQKTATVIHVQGSNGVVDEIVLREHDYVFVTLGSIVESSDNGSLDQPPVLKDKSANGAWELWEKIARKDDAFGNPGVFSDDIELQKWYSFSATLADSTFHDYMEDFTGNVAGTGGLVTMTDSNWLMSIVIAHQPHFPNQPKGLYFFWGYGLYPDRLGNHVKKKMSDCTGADILEELWHHLKIQELMKPVVDAGKVVNCIPTAMPFITSLFMPREPGDRPEVLPDGATNFAFLGQFTEIPHDCVFTVEYSVRSAQTAVYGLFETDKEVLPVYASRYMPKYLAAAAQAIAR